MAIWMQGVHAEYLCANICMQTHTNRAQAADPICPSSSGSTVATRRISPPPVMSNSLGRIHHLVGSLGASQLHPRGPLGDGSSEALGWSLLSPRSSCVGDRERCSTDVGVWSRQKVRSISASAMFVIPPFLWGKSRPLIWLTAKHLAFVPDLKKRQWDRGIREEEKKRKRDLEPEEKSGH